MCSVMMIIIKQYFALSVYLLWLSVRVIPCKDTLKWTAVSVGNELAFRDLLMALATAFGPVRDSMSTDFMYRTLQAADINKNINILNTIKNLK